VRQLPDRALAPPGREISAVGALGLAQLLLAGGAAVIAG
jgi:hypothetical protein